MITICLEGWSTTPDGEVEYLDGDTFTMGPDSINTLYAVWGAIKYTIKFESDGGSKVNDIIAEYGEKITAPNDPIRACHTFDGWYIDVALTQRFTFDKMPGEDITLYAKWIEIQGTNGLVYSYNGVSYEVTDYTGTDSEVVIPATYNGKPVTFINPLLFIYTSHVTKVEIPYTIERIGPAAFSGESLVELVIDGNNPYYTIIDGVVFSKDKTKLVTYLGGLDFDDYHVPEHVTFIDNYAFMMAEKLTNITIPKSVTIIGSAAFAYCPNLNKIIIPDSVNIMGDIIFVESENILILVEAEMQPAEWSNLWNDSNHTVIWGFTALKSDDIFEYALSSTGATVIEHLKPYQSEVVIPETVDSIPVTNILSSVFQENYNITSVVIPSGVKEINPWSFSGCPNLSNVIFSPDSQLEIIHNRAFNSCQSLELITLPDSVTVIGSDAFAYCTSLSEIFLPANLNRIEDYAFESCTSLVRVVIPDGTRSIGDKVFRGCIGLKTLIIPDSVYYMGNNVVEYCNNVTVYTKHHTEPSGWNADWNSEEALVIWGFVDFN